MVSFRSFRTLGEVHFQNLRDDLACLADQHRIADADIPLGNKVLVVEGGIGHGGTSQTDRTNHRLGSQNTGSAHLNHDILHNGGLDFGRIFVGCCPPGEFCGGTQTFPLGQVIHLDNGTVNVTGQLLPGIVDGCHFLPDGCNVRESLLGDHLEFKGSQIFQGFRMAGEFCTLTQLDIEDIDIQSPFCCNLGIQLPQRTGCGIPGIGKQGLPFRLLTLIQLFKALFGHEHLAPDDQAGRGIFDGHGDRLDGFQVLRYILSHIAVTAGSAPEELAVHIFQRHGKTIDLGFHGKAGIGLCGFNLGQEFLQLFHAEHILQAHQGHRMGYLLKLAQGFAAHPLGGRIGSCQFRVSGFQLFQHPQKAVIFKVRHLRIIQHIIAVVGILQKLSQFQNSLFGIHNILRSVEMFGAHPPR